MQIFLVKGNGEVHEIKSDAPIKTLLDKKESHILCDDISRVVYLWKGSECSVRSKFIGANKLQEIRGQVGLNYKSVSMDEDEVDDYPDFLSAIEQPRTDGFAKEIIEDMELKFEIGGGPSRPKTYASVVGSSSKYNQAIEQSGPLYTGSQTVPSAAGASQPAVTHADLDKIIDSLDEAGIPEGFHREMVIMGKTAYSVSEKVQVFLGKKQVEHILEPISSLPEGIFLAEGYTPRILVEGKTIIAIEFLKHN
ncbi:hypothetical protein DSAG12_01764 [Promethearchaeum syntrophicum]|uniref:Gelsolin-like domain-containing protein n=1 Tax=Promethearchaeum syntrophicum TaxID=2594042 RepID=A0A5B9DAT8_9ARCH|nr:hypothetical protein [Candidatus Prometheoarchaeum syntrophicum]QEE15937.1 hypothetical protein DSAG12_01764 [Candidatus Prometheoarchaeum syntrophicum]